VANNGSGNVGAGNVTNVSVSCTTSSFTIGGSVTGLAGSGLMLQNNGTDNKIISANGVFTFATPIASGQTYNVSVLTQPSVPEQACTVLNGAGTVVSANVTNVSVVCSTPSPRFAYVPNFGDNTLSIYAVNAATGQLRHNGYVATGTGPDAVSIDPSGKFVYVANQTSGTVSAYTINSATGALTKIGDVAAGTSPQSIVVDPTGNFVYVANAGLQNGTGSVSAYTITGGGALSQITCSEDCIDANYAAGTNPSSLSVDPSDRFVYVANDAGNNISVYSINAGSGALTPVGGAPVAAGQKPMWITVDPSGKFAYATNFTSNTVSAYTIDATLGLIPITPDVATGIGPRSIAVDPSGKFAYVVNQNGGITGSVSAYSIGATGALTPTGAADVATGNIPVGIAIDPSGKLAYVANVGSDDISAYSIDTTGALTVLPKTIGRLQPEAMAMTKGAPLIYTPKFAYVANSVSNNISAYTIDAGIPPTPGTGVLTAIGSPVTAGTAPTSVSVDLFGRYAYVVNGGDGVNPSTVSAYIITGTGALSANGTAPTGVSPASVSVDVSGRFAYVANRGDGLTASTVSAYTIDSGGVLSANGTAPAGTGPASVTIDPSGRFAYVANFNSNDVSAYAISVTTGALTQIDAIPATPLVIDNFATGTGPQSVSVHPSGNFAYVPNGDGTIWVYRIDSTNGALISIGSIGPRVVGTNTASIAFDAAGKYLYVAEKGDALVAAYSINPSTGGLTFLGTIGTGTSPASVTIDASGQFAYVANSGDGTVSAYKVNSGTGALSAVSSPFSAGSTPSSVVTTGTIQ